MADLMKQFDEFNSTVQWYMHKTDDFIKNFEDLFRPYNIRLSICGGQYFDQADFSIRVKIIYIIEYPSTNMPIEFSSCNQGFKIVKDYSENFNNDNVNHILEDWKNIFTEWTEIKKAPNRELAIKKIGMLVKTNKIAEDFS